MTACRSLGQDGVRMYVFTRLVATAEGPAGDWVNRGEVCVGAGTAAAPALVTPAMVQAAFEHLPFTPAAASIQPVKGRTLVNLVTYYEARFPSVRVGGKASVGPGASARVRLLGHEVVIVPAARSYSYDFGDGQGSGSTSDAGGTWPTGGIRHTYLRAGQLSVRITTTYGGTYVIDGSEPIPLPGTVSIPGRAFPLTVLSATNRLYADLP
jgi:hypothetical protein